MAKQTVPRRRKTTRAGRTKSRSRNTVVETEIVRSAAVQVPPCMVEQVTTTTEIETIPKVEVRKPATLAQALTEPEQVVVKPEKRAVSRTIKKRRIA